MANEDPFISVVPGQSLTKTPGSAPFEQPPMYSTPEEAADAVWERLTRPKKAAELKAVLNAGVPAEAIANTVIRAGFNEGLWTPDVGMLISDVVMGQVVALGKRMKADKMKIFLDEPSSSVNPAFAVDEEQVVDGSAGTEVVQGEGEMEEPSSVGMGLLGALKAPATEGATE